MLNILFQDVQVLAELPLKEGNRVAFKELKLSYYNVEALLFTFTHIMLTFGVL